MERLSGLDAAFLNGETPAIHMHTLKVAIVDPPPDGGSATFARFREETAKRLHLLPLFRRRAVNVPLGFHHPVWVEDPLFDLDYHLRRIALPAPGGQRELDAVVGDIASHRLDRDHPLWEIWQVEGLADGSLGYVAKIHHALADGLASAHLLEHVFSPSPDATDPAPPPAPWAPHVLPSRSALFFSAFPDHVRRLGKLPPLIGRTIGGIRRTVRGRRQDTVTAPLPFGGPRTSLNRGLTAARSFATARVPLDHLRTVKSALAISMNDVVLAVVAGALLRLLAGRNEHPRRPLVATVPVATMRPGDEHRLTGNRLSNLFTSLCTDIDDPLARAHAIHDTMIAARNAHERLGSSLMEEWMEYLPPPLLAALMRLGSRLEPLHRPAANVVVSNVRGPATALYVAGARLRHLYSVGPIVEGVGINVTAWSYADELSFTVLASREALPEAHDVTDALMASLAELVELAATAGAHEPGTAASDLGAT
jgi:diacylglycerol O-acyltransferase